MDGVEIWIYGSRARGDADELSDTDVLVVADPDAQVGSVVAALTYPRITVSRYSWSEMESMWAYGSLYLHHLRLEGRRLWSAPGNPERLTKLIATVPRSRARERIWKVFGRRSVRRSDHSRRAVGRTSSAR
jgi:hypothetical protein